MSNYFWKDWPFTSKVIYWIFLLLAFLSLLFFGYAYIAGNNLTINWKTVSYFQTVDVILDNIRVFPFILPVESDNLLILQRFKATPFEFSQTLNYVFLSLISLAFVFLLTIASFLPRIWYLLGMGVWIVILSSFRPELLMLFGKPDYMALIIIGGSTVLLAYYFNAFAREKSYLFRLIAFLILFCILAGIIFYFSEVPRPFLYLVSQSIIPLLLLCAVFTLMVAHEIMASFIFIITGASSGGSKNHVHFLVISIIYLANLILLYLHHSHIFTLNIWYIDPYLLLIISSILGIWGYRQREKQYENIFSFYPLGGYFYLTLMFVSFLTIGYLYATSNDPAFEVIEEAIIYGHLSFGVIFVLYVLANFSGPLSQGLKVHKLLFKPQTMPYFIFRFAGLIGVFAFAIIANWEVPFYYTFGAYFNQQGDHASYREKPLLSETYYQQSRIYSYLNHHANYALANYYHDKKEIGKATLFYQTAINSAPSPHAYVNLADIYHKNNRYFDALFTLQDGVKRTNSAQVQNNLALLYSSTEVIDSTFFFLEKALHDNDVYHEAIANLEAFAAAHDLASYMDSLEFDKEEDDIITFNNKVVRYNKQNRFFGPVPDILRSAGDDNLFAAGLMYNYLINTIYHNDTTGINASVLLADKFSGSVYNEKVRFGQSVADYYHHNYSDAFRRLNSLANTSYTDNAAYFRILGLWSLEQQAPDQAARFLNMAKQKGDQSIAWLEAFSLLMNGDIDSTLQVLESNTKDTVNTLIIKEMALASPNGTDKEKVFYVNYHLSYTDTLEFNEIISSIEDDKLKAEAIMSFSEKLFDYHLTDKAIETYALLTELKLNDKALFEKIREFELRLFADKGRIMSLANYINDNQIEFEFSDFPNKVFYAGLMNAASGDSTAALHNFRWIAQQAPFMEMEVVKATDYIRNFSDDRFEVYNLLLNALEINPNSVRLLMAYIIEATSIGLENFAKTALEDLQKLLSPEHFQQFKESLKQYENMEEEF